MSDGRNLIGSGMDAKRIRSMPGELDLEAIPRSESVVHARKPHSVVRTLPLVIVKLGTADAEGKPDISCPVLAPPGSGTGVLSKLSGRGRVSVPGQSTCDRPRSPYTCRPTSRHSSKSVLGLVRVLSTN